MGGKDNKKSKEKELKTHKTLQPSMLSPKKKQI